MRIFNTNRDDMVPSRHFLATTSAENALLLGDDSASLIACIEDQALFSGLRDDVHQHFTPATRFEQHVADSIAEELWRKARYSLLESTALSAAIERDWDSVTKECPNADPAYRTYAAFRQFGPRDTACVRAGQDFETRSWRRSRADIAALQALRSNPS
ncbi:hypothetical protein [Paludibaculum fermentans]|uniref:Uncharacterized protein n=1 Tax=Paludibaculum fermentans TaxID=1473598 RepID=A0A7S7NSM5_PALFE|nr:hypothetical protein [Paludibaculum fermentans]QOY88961.1 hypothetical protein IRI77_03080 [Paludibaculum fermentans]